MRSLSVHVKSRTRPSHTCHSYSIQIPSGWGISKLLTQQGFMHVLLLFRFRPSLACCRVCVSIHARTWNCSNECKRCRHIHLWDSVFYQRLPRSMSSAIFELTAPDSSQFARYHSPPGSLNQAGESSRHLRKDSYFLSDRLFVAMQAWIHYLELLLLTIFMRPQRRITLALIKTIPDQAACKFPSLWFQVRTYHDCLQCPRLVYHWTNWSLSPNCSVVYY